MTDKSWPKIFGGLLIAATFLYIFNAVDYIPDSDDDYFLRSLDDTTLLNFAIARYFTISGRIPLEALMVSTIGMPLFWKLAIPCCFLLVCYCIWKIALKGAIDFHYGVPLVILLYFLMDPNVLKWSSWWVTGFYNYLLPTSLGLYACNAAKYLSGKCCFFVRIVSPILD